MIKAGVGVGSALVVWGTRGTGCRVDFVMISVPVVFQVGSASLIMVVLGNRLFGMASRCSIKLTWKELKILPVGGSQSR